MCFKVFFVLAAVVTASLCTIVDFKSLNCKDQLPPANASLHCTMEVNSQDVRCQLKCNQGYDVKYLAARYYVCHGDGKWTTEPVSADTRWPDCKIFQPDEPVP